MAPRHAGDAVVRRRVERAFALRLRARWLRRCLEPLGDQLHGQRPERSSPSALDDDGFCLRLELSGDQTDDPQGVERPSPSVRDDGGLGLAWRRSMTRLAATNVSSGDRPPRTTTAVSASSRACRWPASRPVLGRTARDTVFSSASCWGRWKGMDGDSDIVAVLVNHQVVASFSDLSSSWSAFGL